MTLPALRAAVRESSVPQTTRRPRGRPTAAERAAMPPRAPQALASTTAFSLENFDTLPDSALVAVPVVIAVFGRSPASVWRDVKAGRLPSPVAIGPRSTRWRVGDLRRALADLRERAAL